MQNYLEIFYNQVIQILLFPIAMGNQCFSSTINQHYATYLAEVNISELKEKWSPIQVYKIKKIFDLHAVSLQNKDGQNQKHIPFQHFKQMFSEFSRYQEKYLHRIFNIFDFHNKSLLDWVNFFQSITICYYAPQNILSLLMFMTFDEAIVKKINKDQISNMIQLNSDCLKQSGEQCNQTLFDAQQVIDELMKDRQFITVDQWRSQSSLFIDFQKHRRFYNIFIEEKLQKQLINNFFLWNDLYSQKQQKYVSYVINYKWFQIWRMYVLSNYGAIINIEARNPNTLKTMKTVKSLKYLKRTLKSIASIKTSKKILIQPISCKIIKTNKKNQSVQSSINNYDFIYSNIGQKPAKMYNNMLQGQFQEVLASQLVQNMHYMLVSEKIWQKFKTIYNGHPQFRRTGESTIQLYPKVIKIYSELFKQKIDFSSQIIRQVSGFLSVKQLLVQSLEFQQQSFLKRTVFFKTFGMNRWEELLDLQIMFTGISSQVIIFLAHVQNEDVQNFKRSHCRIALTIQDINIGDQIKYQDPRNPSIKRPALYMGQNTEGKHLIHFKGQSFANDLCVNSNLFYKKSTLNSKYINSNTNTTEDPKNFIFQMIGIPDLKGYNLINTIILSLMLNPDFKQILLSVNTAQPKQPLQILAYILKQCRKKSLSDSNIISDLIEIYLPDYQNFQLGMFQKFFFDFMKLISNELNSKNIENVVEKQMQLTFSKQTFCTHCKTRQTQIQQDYAMILQVPESIEKYYQFVFVPFSSTLKSQQLKKCGFKLKLFATFKNYKDQVQKIVNNIKNSGTQNITFVVCQVYGNDIIKNYGSVKVQATLEDLCLRDTDEIYVYELYCDLDQFVQDHYTQVKDITSKNFKVGHLVDCKTQNNKWSFGKIMQIQHMLYTRKTLLTVQHIVLKQIETTSYEVQHHNIGIFPTKSYLNGQQYHLKVIQRYFNESLNEMQSCNIPLIITLTNWMRCRQFQFLIYQQIKILIAQSYQFKDSNHQAEIQNGLMNNNNYNLRTMYTNSKRYKISRFKQHLHSEQFPYRITLIDKDGRCIICHKYQKSIIYKGQAQFYCEGCKIKQQDPISWQLKIKLCIVCIDWKNSACYKKDIAKDHSSFTNMIMNKKNDVQNLQKLISSKFITRKQSVELLCCNFPYITVFSQKLKSNPSILNIQIQRLVIQGNSKKINDKYVSFPFVQLKINSCFYDLVSIVAIQKRKTIVYKTYYLGQNQEWYEFHAEKVKKVKKNTVQKCCALLLTYKRTTNDNQLVQCAQLQEQDFEDSNQKRQKKRKMTKNLTIAKRLEDQQFSSSSVDQITSYNEKQSSQASPRSSQKKSGKLIKVTSEHVNKITNLKRANKNLKYKSQKKQQTILFSQISIRKTSSENQCVYKSNKSTKIKGIDSNQISSEQQDEIVVKTNRIVDFNVKIEQIESLSQKQEQYSKLQQSRQQTKKMCDSNSNKSKSYINESKKQLKSIKFANINNEKQKSQSKVNFNIKFSDKYQVINQSISELEPISLDSDEQYI